MIIAIPDPSLILLVGPAGVGKSTFARRHFRPTEVLSSDFFRGMACDDEADQSASGDAFSLLHHAAAVRLGRNRFTVVDATNLQADARKPLLEIAHRHHFQTAALVFALPEAVCRERDAARAGRVVGPHVVRNHVQQLQQGLVRLHKENHAAVHVLSSPEEVDAAVVERRPLPVDRRHECGPFDLIGDVHGCFEELRALLGLLGYQISSTTDADGRPDYAVAAPPGRKAVFVGDLVDRGPDSVGVLRLAMGMVRDGSALCVVGNHDDKLMRKLRGNDVKVAHGLAETLAQLDSEPEEFRERVRAFVEELPSHYVLDGGRLVVAHGGLKEHYHGRVSKRVREFALYGDVTGETDEFGLPVRLNWAAEYNGTAAVVYGHTPVLQPEWVNNTIDIDAGCVFGNRLAALRWPEKELVSVPALRAYREAKRPLAAPAAPAEAVPPPAEQLP